MSSLTNALSSPRSATLTRRSVPMVDEVPDVGVAEQKLPNPCVG